MSLTKDIFGMKENELWDVLVKTSKNGCRLYSSDPIQRVRSLFVYSTKIRLSFLSLKTINFVVTPTEPSGLPGTLLHPVSPTSLLCRGSHFPEFSGPFVKSEIVLLVSLSNVTLVSSVKMTLVRTTFRCLPNFVRHLLLCSNPLMNAPTKLSNVLEGYKPPEL